MFMELFQSENLYFIILGVFSFVNSQFDECMINNASQCLSVLPGTFYIGVLMVHLEMEPRCPARRREERKKRRIPMSRNQELIHLTDKYGARNYHPLPIVISKAGRRLGGRC